MMNNRLQASTRPAAARNATVGLLSFCIVSAILGSLGCVTEKRPLNRSGSAIPDARPAVRTGSAETGATTPVARPAHDASTTSSRITVALLPVGEVPFDGLVLPVFSPDASFMATQVGEAPTWDALLASPEARSPFRARLEAYDLTGKSPKRLDRVALPAGWILGRDADAQGFLAEVINPDGSRDLAKVPWDGGAPRWLVRTGAVNAHGAITPDAGVIYCTREVDQPRFAIALMHAGAEVVYADPDASLLYPIPTPEPGLFYCYALTRAAGLELRLIRAGASADAAMQVVGVWPLLSGTNATAMDAYQCAARASVRDQAPYELLALHPRMGSVAIFDPASATAAPLHRGSIAGAWIESTDPLRVLLTAREGLMHQQVSRIAASGGGGGGGDGGEGGLSAREAARVEREPWVPVSTTDPEFPWVLIGPVDDASAASLVLVRMGEAGARVDQSSSE